jgi:cytochrome c biogenesis protein CcdA
MNNQNISPEIADLFKSVSSEKNIDTEELDKKLGYLLEQSYRNMPSYDAWEKQKLKYYLSKIIFIVGAYITLVLVITLSGNISNLGSSIPSYVNILFLLIVIFFLFTQVLELEGLIYKLDKHYKLRLKLKELEMESRKNNKNWTYLSWNDSYSDLNDQDIKTINRVIKTNPPRIF